MEETSRRGMLGRHQSCNSEGIDILSDSMECNYLSRNTSSLLYSKVVRLKIGEVLYEKAYMSPRPPPKISLRHDWTKELGSQVDRQPEEVDRQPEGEVARQAKFFQPTQPIPSPIRDRSGRLGFTQDVIIVQACSSEDSKSLNVEQTPGRSGRPGKDTVTVQDDPEVYHEAETLNINDETIRERIEADMGFKIPGPPHSIVKHAQSASVRGLIQKIENHPNRHALQQDLGQNQAYNPFCPESKKCFRMWKTLNCVNCSRRNPKRSAKYVYHTGTLAMSITHAGTSGIKEERQIRNSSSLRWTSFPFPTTS